MSFTIGYHDERDDSVTRTASYKSFIPCQAAAEEMLQSTPAISHIWIRNNQRDEIIWESNRSDQSLGLRTVRAAISSVDLTVDERQLLILDLAGDFTVLQYTEIIDELNDCLAAEEEEGGLEACECGYFGPQGGPGHHGDCEVG